jgi:PAS domain S-box-containing protein
MNSSWCVRTARCAGCIGLPKRFSIAIHHLIEIQSIGRDMTEQHVKDEMLRNNEERYRRIVETAQEGIWLVDAQGCITFVNVRMAEILGCTVEEMLGQPLCDFMDEEWRTMATHWLEHRRPGIVEQHDIKFRRKEGGEVWVHGFDQCLR